MNYEFLNNPKNATLFLINDVWHILNKSVLSLDYQKRAESALTEIYQEMSNRRNGEVTEIEVRGFVEWWRKRLIDQSVYGFNAYHF